MIWGGTAERWDFFQLEKGGPPTGGEQLRERIRRLMEHPSSAGEPATFQLSRTMQVRGWALAADLEDVEITRRGRAFARLTAPEQAADRSFDLHAFLAVATSQPMHDGRAADTFIENLREQARF